jgi:hypothetical protein
MYNLKLQTINRERLPRFFSKMVADNRFTPPNRFFA